LRYNTNKVSETLSCFKVWRGGKKSGAGDAVGRRAERAGVPEWSLPIPLEKGSRKQKRKSTGSNVGKKGWVEIVRRRDAATIRNPSGRKSHAMPPSVRKQMQTQQTKTKCVLYARKSTEEDDKQVMSIDAQLFELKEYAHREQIEIVRVFTESKSAKTPGRDEFAKMITYIESSREPLGILSWHPDRLARNSVDGGRIIYLVDINKIASLRFPQFWFEPTPQGKFMLQVAFGQSKYFSDNLVENVKRGIRQKLRKGEWLCLAPKGYVNNMKTRNIEPDPVMSRVIKLAFEEYATGTQTLESLSQFMADHGMVSKHGTPLPKVAMVRMLTNRAYLGFIKHHDEWHPGNFEPIISPTLFEAVQKLLTSRKKPRKSKVALPFAFTGFATCGECGCAITAQYATNRWGTRYTYYRCTKKGGACAQPYTREDTLATQLHALLQSVSLPLSEIEEMNEQITAWEQEAISEKGSVAQNLKTKLSESKEKLDKLVSVYLDGDIERATYLERKDVLLRQKAKLEESFKDFGQQRKNWIEPLRSFVSSLQRATELEKTSNHNEWKKFFQSIGSNPTISEKSVSIHWGDAWDFAVAAKAGRISDCRRIAAAYDFPLSNSDLVSTCAGGGT